MSDYAVYTMTGTDTQNTRVVINTMRNIVLNSCRGNRAGKTRAVVSACFGGVNIATLSDARAARLAATFVRNNIRYQSDPEDTEYIMYPHVIYREGYGDCDDMTVLFCALLHAIGIDTTIEAIKYRGDKYYSHVYARVKNRVYDCTLPPSERPHIVAGDRLMAVKVYGGAC